MPGYSEQNCPVPDEFPPKDPQTVREIKLVSMLKVKGRVKQYIHSIFFRKTSRYVTSSLSLCTSCHNTHADPAFQLNPLDHPVFFTRVLSPGTHYLLLFKLLKSRV